MKSTPRMQRAPLGTQIADHLRDEILLERIPAGTPLSQQQLCEDYGTSRMPVRDAIRQLQYEGLVYNTDGGHHVVANLTRGDLEDSFRAEAFVHSVAARRASENATAADIDELRNLHRSMVEAVDRGALDAVVELNWRFHRHINHMARSRKLIAIIRAVSLSVPRGYVLEIPDWANRANAEHESIIEAIESRQLDRVEVLIRDHIEEAGRNFLQHRDGLL